MRDTEGHRIGIADIKASASAIHSPEELNDLIAIITSEDPIKSRNAAWVMTHFTAQQLLLVTPWLNQIIDIIIATQNQSLRRLLLNVIEQYDNTHGLFAAETLRTDFLDFCLEHMYQPWESAGVQSLCIKLAYRQCSFYPELLLEYKNTLQLMQQGYAHSVMMLRKKFLNKLSRVTDRNGCRIRRCTLTN